MAEIRRGQLVTGRMVLAESPLRLGQLVLVTGGVPAWGPPGDQMSWMPEMGAAVGRVGWVLSLEADGVRLRVPGVTRDWYYPPEVLTPVSQGPVTEAEFLNLEW